MLQRKAHSSHQEGNEQDEADSFESEFGWFGTVIPTDAPLLPLVNGIEDPSNDKRADASSRSVWPEISGAEWAESIPAG